MRDSLRAAELATAGTTTSQQSTMSRKPSVFAKFTNKFNQSNSSASESPEATSPQQQDKSAYLKRREQVRRAQKTHRERRAEYLRRLENEVADLRRKDALQASRIRELEAVLTANSIEYPLHTINESMQDVQVAPDGRQTLPFPSENSGPRARVEIVGSAGEAQNLRITLPPDMLSIPGALSPMAADPQTAIDFVLSLEAPCLYHHHGVISATSADDLDLGPLSHAMMLQAPIMAQAPPLPATLRKQSYFSAGEAWDVSATEIERLLYFSMQLPLPQGEITPVQAWSRISSNADMTQEALNRMRSLLVKQMKCYGFGAVVDENLFQGALLEAVKQQ